MSIQFKILGGRTRDNAALVTVDNGRGRTELLFDCGEGCLDGLGKGRRRTIDGVFFSHFHMDHIAGFDGFFRHTFGRNTMPNRVWGPQGTGAVMQHRFQGFVWNMLGSRQAHWIVEDIAPERITTARFELSEAFAVRHDEGTRPFTGRVWETDDFTVDAVVMDHGTDSIAYILRETPRINVDMDRLAAMGLTPGPWMQALKGDAEIVMVGDQARDLGPLRSELLVETPGASIAYFTDFYLDEAGIERVAPLLSGCDTLVCEAQYRHADLDLARRNHHMTATLTAQLARAAEVGHLVLFHISERYEIPDQDDLLAEAQAIFPATSFPDHW
jgi:ribonuclease Z